MPITTAYVPETFQGDGVSTAFAITFPYQLSTDIVAQTTVVATGVITTLVLGTDYSVTPASNSPAGTGTVTLLLAPLAVGTDITISRAVPTTQLTTWVPNDPNPSTAVMNAVDKLTMEMQQFNYRYGGRSWYLRPTDVDGSGAFDARGNRGTNLGAPTTGTDAVNVNYLQQYVSSVVLTGSTTVAPVFTFTGDGTTTSFSMSGVTISFASGFQVSVDGLIQTPTSDYTIVLGNPSSINFTSAPPLNTTIVVIVRGFAAPAPGGAATAATFLRGDGTYASALIGAGGAPAINVDTAQLFGAGQIGVDSAIRVTTDSTHIGYYRFGVSGSGNVFNAAIGYSAANAAVGFYSQSTPLGALSSFYDTGNVYLGNSLFVQYGGFVGIGKTNPAYTLDVVGNVNITGNYTGNASGALITSGQVLPQFLAANAPSASTFLRGDGIWSIPPGGGGGAGSFNTTTTASFVVATISSSQTVALTTTTGLNVGNYIYISDGTHGIIGQVTGLAGLNATVVTSSILAGASGQTMASGAAVALSIVPGLGSIEVTDAAIGVTSVPRLIYDGSLGVHNQNVSVSNAVQIILQGAFRYSYITPIASAQDGLIVYDSTNSGNTKQLLASSAGCLLASSGGILSFGSLNAQYIAANTGTASATTFLRGDNSWSGLTPAPIVATNSPSVGQVLTYANSGQFTWANAGAGGLPSGGTTAKFLRGDATWSNLIHGSILSSNSGETAYGGFSYGLISRSWGGGVSAVDEISFFTNSGGGPSNWCIYSLGAMSVGDNSLTSNVFIDNVPASSIDLPTETLVNIAMARTVGLRTTHGPWQFVYTPAATSGSITFDLANGAYQRITPTGAITMTLADTTPVPTAAGWQFASVLTLEIVGTVTMTWDASITWAGGASAPTLTSGTNILRFIKRQNISGWIGYVENVSSGSYTDAQARTAVLQSAYLIGTSTVQVSVTGGTSATFSIPAAGVGTTQLANSAVTIAKISATGTPSSTTYLRGDGTWATPSASSGQAAIQFQANGSNLLTSGIVNLFNVTTQQGSGAPTTSAASVAGTNAVTLNLPWLAYQINGVAQSGLTAINFPSGSTVSGTTLNVASGGGGGSTLPTVSSGVQNWLLSNDGTNAVWRGGASTPIPGNFIFSGSTLGLPALGSADNGVEFTNSIFSSGIFGSGSFCTTSLGFTSNYISGAPGFNAININMSNKSSDNNGFVVPLQVGVVSNSSVPITFGKSAASFNSTIVSSQTSGFSICVVANNMHYNQNGGCTGDTLFFTSIGPNAYYSSSAGHGVDPNTGTYHAFTQGSVRIGEVNYANAWSDFGLQETRGLSSVCVGLEFFPQYQAGRVAAGATFHEYPAQWAIAIGNSGQNSSKLVGNLATNYIGILLDKNALAPNGYGLRLRGASGTFNGASASSNAPGALIKMSDTAKTGIDFAGSTNENTPLTATSTGSAVIQMLDGQSIRIGTSVWIRGSGTHVQYSTDGSTWSNIV